MTDQKSTQFKHLLEKYRSNSLSEEEFATFIRLLGHEQIEDENDLETQAEYDWRGSKAILTELKANQVERKNRNWWMGVAWKSAAALLVLTVVWVFWPQEVPQNIVFQTNFGETRNVDLPDGSQVLLNANSKLIWSGDWEDKMQRSVTLTGEAFFDVKNTDNMAFEVHTPLMKVRVLGTEFNVKTRDEETQVFLQSGKVKLNFEDAGKEVVNMDPGDFVRFDHVNSTMESITRAHKEEKASWVDGMLEFQNESVSAILAEFKNLYGKSFRVDNTKMLDKRMDVSLPYADWDLVRKALEIALDVKFTSSNDTIIVE